MMPSVVESGDVGKGHCLRRSASDDSSGYADVFISCGREGLFFRDEKNTPSNNHRRCMTLRGLEERRRLRRGTRSRNTEGGRIVQVLVQCHTRGEPPQHGSYPAISAQRNLMSWYTPSHVLAPYIIYQLLIAGTLYPGSAEITLLYRQLKCISKLVKYRRHALDAA